MINWLSNTKPLKAITMIFGLLILSYIFVHLFAVLGIFIAVAYPLLWILFPQFTTCIYCRNTEIGKKCKSCNQIVENKVSPPKTFRSVIFNSLTILFVSVISTGTVYLEYNLLKNRDIIPREQKLVEFIIPESKQYKIGEVFPIELDVNTNEISVNAVQTDLSFDTEMGEIVKISLEKSFAQIFIQKEVNNEKGYLRITGGLPNPGFEGEKGHFATIYLKSKKAGLFEISYLPTSMVLANNGNGTNILESYPTITYIIKPEYISDTEKEIQDAIYFSNVLGMVSNDDQILFFDEEEEFVLGEDDVLKIETKDFNFDFILKIIGEIDSWIVDSVISIFLSRE